MYAQTDVESWLKFGYWKVESLEYNIRNKGCNEFGMTDSWAGESDMYLKLEALHVL